MESIIICINDYLSHQSIPPQNLNEGFYKIYLREIYLCIKFINNYEQQIKIN